MALIQLYYLLASPPCRAVLLCLVYFKIPHQRHQIDLLKQEHLKPDFLQKNPFHTIPVIKDQSLTLWDSHAINMYLCNAYDEERELYPDKPKKRSIVDRQLFYEADYLYPLIKKMTQAVLAGQKSISKEDEKLFRDQYEALDHYFNITKFHYAAGHDITIADFSFSTTLMTMAIYVLPGKSKYPSLVDYLLRCTESIPLFADVNENGLEEYRKFLRNHNFTVPEYSEKESSTRSVLSTKLNR